MDAKIPAMKVRFILFLLFFLSIPFALKELTDGFRLAKLQFDFPAESRWDLPLDPSVLAVLSQPFNYLGKGTQSYVFESKDGKYVVKMLRFDRKRGEKKVLLLFEAFRMAYEHLREETGLLYVHLNPSSKTLPLLHVKDPMGRSLKIDLDSIRFAVQKKGVAFEKALLGARNDPPSMEKMLSQFLHLLEERSAKGIWNKDPSLARNFGFLGTRAIEIDFGSYRLGEREESEVIRYSKKMRRWLLKRAPEWVSRFDELCEKREIEEGRGVVPGEESF